MSYGIKYYVEFKDYFNKNIQILFKFKDYDGFETELRSIENTGEIYQPDNETNVFNPVRGSEFRIDLVSLQNFQLTDLFVTGKRDVMVDVNVNGSLFWRGWVIPNQYSEAYKAPPYPVTITARDGLGELKTYDWEFSGFISPSIMLFGLLNKLELELDLWEAVNLYETDYMNTGVADTPLNQCEYNCDSYVGMSYYDVLADMMTGLCSEIQQVNGYWKITRIEEAKAGQLVRRKIGLFSLTSDNDTENITKLIGRPQSRDFANVDAEILVSPGWNKYKRKRDAGRKYGFLNYNFQGEYETTPSGQIAKGWTRIGVTEVQKGRLSSKSVQRGTSFNNTTGTFSYGISQTILGVEALPTFGQTFVFKCSIAITKKNSFFNTQILAGMKTFVSVFDGTNTYYLNPLTGGWSTTINYIEFRNIDTQTDDRPAFVNYEIAVTPPVVSGQMAFFIYAPYPVIGSNLANLEAWYVAEASVDTYNTVLGEYDEQGFVSSIPIEYFQVNQNMTFIPQDELTFKFSDFPDFQSTKLIYSNGIVRSAFDQTRTKNWQSRGGDKIQGLELHMIDSYFNMYYSSRWILRGTILSDDIRFDHTIVDYQVNGKMYYCKSGTYNLRNSMFMGTWHEIGLSPGSPWILEDGTWNDEGVWVDAEVWNDTDPAP